MNLTPRQIEILRLTADGYTCPAIARRLFIEANTVKSHRLYMYRRLRARNAAHAVAIAYRRGILGSLSEHLVTASKAKQDVNLVDGFVDDDPMPDEEWQEFHDAARRVGQWREKSDYYQQAAQASGEPCPVTGAAQVFLADNGEVRWKRADEEIHVARELLDDPDVAQNLLTRYQLGVCCPKDFRTVHATRIDEAS